MVRQIFSSDSKPLDPFSKRIALQVEYEGTRYMGFQFQPEQPTIQGEIEKAIHQLTGETTRIRGASRTDSGVHAYGQIVDGLIKDKYSIRTVQKALNHYLPSDITIECEGNGFLRQQIRRANAILIEIGKNKWPDTSIKDTLEDKFEKGKSHTVLPALGLCLMEVKYYNFWDKVIN